LGRAAHLNRSQFSTHKSATNKNDFIMKQWSKSTFSLLSVREPTTYVINNSAVSGSSRRM
jgi:hypothetical protein